MRPGSFDVFHVLMLKIIMLCFWLYIHVDSSSALAFLSISISELFLIFWVRWLTLKYVCFSQCCLITKFSQKGKREYRKLCLSTALKNLRLFINSSSLVGQSWYGIILRYVWTRMPWEFNIVIAMMIASSQLIWPFMKSWPSADTNILQGHADNL